MTDSEEIVALRQEVANWKLIAIEQARRTDLMNKRLNDYIDRQEMQPPATASAEDLRIVRDKEIDAAIQWDVLTWLDARLVAIEKLPGIVPKKGWIEGKVIGGPTLSPNLIVRMMAAMHRIDPR